MIKLYRRWQELPIIKSPSDCLEVHLPLPYRRGNYRFKFKVIKPPKDSYAHTIEVMAYTRLVRVEGADGYNHFRSIEVSPYKRRVLMYYFEKAVRCDN